MGFSRSNRAADRVEAREVGRDQTSQTLKGLGPEDAWGPWEGLSSGGTASAPGVVGAL